ncbi:MAG: DUF4291 domain-containing protein [Verrucomicrobiota bacterium]
MRKEVSTKYTIKAAYTDTTIRVYQAFRPAIAKHALKAGRFVPPFNMERMTWIKPSFNWMMYRSGFASKPGQEYVLGIDITREGFEWALKNAALSTFHPDIHASQNAWKKLQREKPVRIQWDPERDYQLKKIPNVRAIQIGLSRQVVRLYVEKWIKNIEDMTELAHQIALDVKEHRIPTYLPDQHETTYPFDISRLGIVPKLPEKKQNPERSVHKDTQRLFVLHEKAEASVSKPPSRNR